MGIITFNNVSSATYGINIWTAPNYELPEKDQETYHVPGRSGDLIVDYGSWKNVERSYTVSLGSDNASFPALARALSQWLNSAHAIGYAVLTDSYEPDVYRMAQFKGGISITNVLDHAALATIVFDCKPQRFLLSGANAITVSSGGTIPNATISNANPKLIVCGSGSGSISVGGYPVVFSSLVSEANGGVTVDCEMQECYTGTTSKNSTVTMSFGFPIIPPGGTTLTYDGGVTKVKVVPNTWVL